MMAVEGDDDEAIPDDPPPTKRIKLGTPKEVQVKEEETTKEGGGSAAGNNNDGTSWTPTPLEGQRVLVTKSILRSTPGGSSVNSPGVKKWPLVFDASSPVDLRISSTPESIKNCVDQEEYKGLIARCRRVRIVEEFNNKEAEDDGEGILNHNEGESAPTSDIFETNFAGERMTWVRVDLMRKVDFEKSVTDSFVQSKRTLLTKKFSVEIGHNFIDSATLDALAETKNAIGAMGGGFDFEKAARKRFDWRKDINNVQLQVNKDDWANFYKLKKLDAATNFALTKISEGEIFTFGEIHGKSRGFSQYILHTLKKGSEPESICKGFAFESSLISSVIPPPDYMERPGILFSSTFTPSKQADRAQKHNTALIKESKGDTLNVEITDSYVKDIHDETGGKGVHLLLIDNEEAFCIPELVREIRFQKHIFCQVMIALLAVREGGTLVLKIFDAFTPFTVGLLFILHRCFSHVSFHRLSDSTISSERFCVCLGKRPQNDELDEWTQFLLRIHGTVTRLQEMTGQVQRSRVGSRTWGKRRRRRAPQQEWSNGVSEIVPAAVITSHADFFAVLRRSNVEASQDVIKEVANFVETETRSME